MDRPIPRTSPALPALWYSNLPWPFHDILQPCQSASHTRSRSTFTRAPTCAGASTGPSDVLVRSSASRQSRTKRSRMLAWRARMPWSRWRPPGRVRQPQARPPKGAYSVGSPLHGIKDTASLPALPAGTFTPALKSGMQPSGQTFDRSRRRCTGRRRHPSPRRCHQRGTRSVKPSTRTGSSSAPWSVTSPTAPVTRSTPGSSGPCTLVADAAGGVVDDVNELGRAHHRSRRPHRPRARWNRLL